MGTAYTPGLKVSGDTIIRKLRRLPLKGEVLVRMGAEIDADCVVAKTEIPGPMRTVRVASILGIEPDELEKTLKVREGDTVSKEQMLAEMKSFFGFFTSVAKSPINGKVELISHVSGNVGVRENPEVIQIKSYIDGKVVEVIPNEGVIVETRGAYIQGIFGVGGERQGRIRMAVNDPDDILTADKITLDMAGCVIVGGSCMDSEAIKKATEIGVAGIVAGGIIDKDLIAFLGYDIGVAITGHEKIDISIIVTEGFGEIRMADRTFNLLKALEGQLASINGATQIRAGVIRPEILVPNMDKSRLMEKTLEESHELQLGTHIRAIREPYFGRLGTVSALPVEPQVVESDAKVRVLEVKFQEGGTAIIPRANVEIIQG